jgi:signal transduction histidine kinase/DNA-binding response OmpR family regulator
MAQLAAVAIQSAQLYNQIADELNKRRSTEDALRRSRDELSAANAALEKAARLKDEFLASMSHELRTPLTGILGLSEALQLMTYGNLNEKQSKALKNIESSGRHLLDLINDILDLSKIEAGKFELQFDACSLVDLCQASLQLTKGMAHQKQQVVGFSLNPASIVIHADGRRVKQMLVNLLSNAVKFTPPGGSLGLDVQGSQAEKVVRLSVWDNGIGITRDDLEKLFMPFVQLDSSLSRQQSGTGLGLSLVHRMAELHGGSVQVESTPGAGSRFTIILPWTPDSAQSDPGARRNAAVLGQVLIIEDNVVDADSMTRSLRSLGIDSAVLPSGQNVPQNIIEIGPSIILLDAHLDNISGWEVLAEIKDDERTHDIPVLIVSADDDRPRALSLGAEGYLHKPFGQEELRTELDRVAVFTERFSRLWKAAMHGAGATIVVADDNEVILETIADYLESQRYRVITARNGRELIEMVTEFHPSLILMDIQMPGMDGLEAARRIRALQDPNVARVPIIAITALAMPGDRERCLAAGADEYLSKPIQLDGLIKTIELFLAKREIR